MENFSEIRKGGRPRLIGTDSSRRAVDLACAGSNATERSKQNKYYQLRAIQVLGLSLEPDAAYDYLWLWGRPDEPRDGYQRVRWTILAELGRIEDDDTMRRVAARVCELKLKTRDALLTIRRLRTGRVRAGDALELTNAIIDTINDYTARHGGLGRRDILAALRTAESQVFKGAATAGRACG